MSTSLTPDKDALATTVTPSEILLIVFIHGFKGTNETFGEFPRRLHHVLSETVVNMRIESILFPAYDVSLQKYHTRNLYLHLTASQTKGELVCTFHSSSVLKLLTIQWYRMPPSFASRTGSQR